jgi:hypothetical protein
LYSAAEVRAALNQQWSTYIKLTGNNTELTVKTVGNLPLKSLVTSSLERMVLKSSVLEEQN